MNGTEKRNKEVEKHKDKKLNENLDNYYDLIYLEKKGKIKSSKVSHPFMARDDWLGLIDFWKGMNRVYKRINK